MAQKTSQGIQQMKLYIDTSNTEKIIIGLDNERYEADARQQKAQMLLSFIDETLKEKNKDIKDVTEIKVNVGPGSFTGLRVGLSVANTIGWVLKIPVNGKDVLKNGPISPVYK